MATTIIRDDILRARHIEGDPDLARRIRVLPDDGTIVLRVEGQPIRFRKIPDELADAVRPDPEDAPAWQALRARCGTLLTVEMAEGGAAHDPYLLSVSATLTEWNSPEDAAAYDGL